MVSNHQPYYISMFGLLFGWGGEQKGNRQASGGGCAVFGLGGSSIRRVCLLICLFRGWESDLAD